MRFVLIFSVLFITAFIQCNICSAQTDTLDTGTTEEEEDYSQYENYDFTDEKSKRFCTPKIFELSPAKLISVGFDYQGPFELGSDAVSDGNINWSEQRTKFNGAGGMRVFANIPIVSKTNIVCQLGFNYWRVGFNGEAENRTPLHRSLLYNGLTTAGLNGTVFKPLNEKSFFIAQASADLNGDYFFDNITPVKYTRYSAAIIYGKKTSDRRMIGFGLSRTYRVGELNYIPVMLLNWTAPNRKWGVEMLAPARAHWRRNFSSRKILLIGYELEGNSYRILREEEGVSRNIELRRSELRFRAVWEQSLKNFIWISVQAGYRYGYSFDLDEFNNDREFFRGFFGDQPYLQRNELSGTFYAGVSLNLVSP